MSVEKEVSIDGLTRCTRCRRHVQAGEKPSTTLCPFCDRKAPVSRRGGLLAASLFAMACGGAPPQAEEPVNDPVTEPVVDADETPGNEVAEPTDPEPEPEVVADGDDTPVEPEPEPDPDDSFVRRPGGDNGGVVALYGIAPKRKE